MITVIMSMCSLCSLWGSFEEKFVYLADTTFVAKTILFLFVERFFIKKSYLGIYIKQRYLYPLCPMQSNWLKCRL